VDHSIRVRFIDEMHKISWERFWATSRKAVEMGEQSGDKKRVESTEDEVIPSAEESPGIDLVLELLELLCCVASDTALAFAQ
jgi:hypothetical protein